MTRNPEKLKKGMMIKTLQGLNPLKTKPIKRYDIVNQREFIQPYTPSTKYRILSISRKKDCPIEAKHNETTFIWFFNFNEVKKSNPYEWD